MAEHIEAVHETTGSPIAALPPWGFWCRYSSIGIDDETREALASGTPSEIQRVRVAHLVALAKDWLIAAEPPSRRDS
jgi:hypothetical protein